MSHTDTTRGLIARLGGRAAIAARLQVSPQAVSNWPRDGVPHRHFLALLELAAQRGVSLTWHDLDACRPPRGTA